MAARRLRYYATVPSGFETIAADGLLGGVLPEVHIAEVLDGALLLETPALSQRLTRIGIFQNVFNVLHSTRKLREKAVPAMMSALARMGVGAGLIRASVPRSARTFRVVTSKENRLVRVNPELRRQVERRFSRVSGLSVSPAAADVELWFLERREPRGYVLLRVGRRRATEKRLHRGQLRPEVAHLLCLASGPAADDVFLDPFCGFGSIVLARLEIAVCASVHAVDSDAAKVQHVRKMLIHRKLPGGTTVHVTEDDSRTLPGIPDGSITSVVTDPPWGEYAERAYDIPTLYSRFLHQLTRVCAVGARVILLVSRENPVERIIRERELPMKIVDRTGVLVAGRKATVVRLAVH
jgi:predicted RNA methylase